MGTSYVATFKDVTLKIWWYLDKYQKMHIRIKAIKFGIREILDNNCTINQFMKGYNELKFLEKLTHFDQEQYKTMKKIIIRDVIGNPEYKIQQEL